MFISVNDDEFEEINKWYKSYKFEQTSKMSKMIDVPLQAIFFNLCSMGFLSF